MTMQLADATAELDVRSADERAAIEAAEASAIVIWRGDRLAYRDVPARIEAIPGRAARNALSDAYQEAVAAINPLRERWYGARVAAARQLGFDDVAALHEATSGYRLDELAAEVQRFVFESETVYFAALRRYLALIDIELGDASEADVAYILRGAGFSAWFDVRDLPRITERLAADLALSAPAETSTSDAGYAAYAASLRQLGTTLAAAGAGGRVADPALPEGAGLLFERLLLSDSWLEHGLGIPDEEVPVVADFLAFGALYRLRREAAMLFYEQRLHRGEEATLARAYYSGTIGLLTGTLAPESDYLAGIGDGFKSATGFRASSLAGALRTAVEAKHGLGWWREPAAGEMLHQVLGNGAALRADDVVAQLGYNRLDWRPVLRQLRTQLIGEMSGYGGPNITTRAGTRKV
ncbi:MAG: hypothetical protein ABI534_00415 [Chloroflexota bacterium]